MDDDTMKEEVDGRYPLLTRLSQLRYTAVFPASLLCGIGLLAAGVILLVVAVLASEEGGAEMNYEWGIFAVAALATGILLVTNSSLCLLASEIVRFMQGNAKTAQGKEEELL